MIACSKAGFDKKKGSKCKRLRAAGHEKYCYLLAAKKNEFVRRKTYRCRPYFNWFFVLNYLSPCVNSRSLLAMTSSL